MVSSARRVLVSLFCIFTVFNCNAQIKVVDSLSRLSKTSKDDTERIKAYGALASFDQKDNHEAAFRYCDSAWHIASAIKKNQAGMKCYTLCIYAGIYRLHHDTINYYKKIKEAEYFAHQANDKASLGLVYNQQALYEYDKNNYSEKAFGLFLQSLDLLENSEYQNICAVQNYILSSIFERLADYEASLAYAKKSQKLSTSINDICSANHNIVVAYFHLAENDSTARKYFLDSCFSLSHQTKKTLERSRALIEDKMLPLRIYNDLANIYMLNEHKRDVDSAKFYLNVVLHEAVLSNNDLEYASTSVKLAHYALEEGKIAEAETLLNDAWEAFGKSKVKDFSIKSNLHLGLAKLKEKKGLLKEALADYRLHYQLRDSIYSVEGLNTTKNIETKFYLQKKEQQIKLLKEKEIGHERIVYFSIALAVIIIVSVLMAYRSTRFKKKFYVEKEQLLTQQAKNIQLQKEEAEHALQIQQKESERIELERKLEAIQKEQYQQELMTSVLQLEKTNELLLKLKETVANAPSEKDNTEVSRRILKLIDENLEVDNDFERFSKNFELIYPNFFNRLMEHAVENLSQLDLRYCAYMYMGLSTKEMSNLLNIDPASVRTARYRLKQKFNLGKEIDLVEFLNNSFSVLK